MANYWMHNEFVQVEGEKMSKSLGNFVTIRELLATERFGGQSWDGDVLRLAMFKTPYADPIDWTVGSLLDASNVLNGWWRACSESIPSDLPAPEVIEALANDLNTARVVTTLHKLKKQARFSELHASLLFLGFPQRRYHSGSVDVSGDIEILGSHSSELTEEAAALLQARAEARAAKNWAESDRLRDELAALGIIVKDSKERTTWEFAR
jgi:cysteinyl-tRNA synthetase